LVLLMTLLAGCDDGAGIAVTGRWSGVTPDGDAITLYLVDEASAGSISGAGAIELSDTGNGQFDAMHPVVAFQVKGDTTEQPLLLSFQGTTNDKATFLASLEAGRALSGVLDGRLVGSSHAVYFSKLNLLLVRD
jgi:hypothetical protein